MLRAVVMSGGVNCRKLKKQGENEMKNQQNHPSAVNKRSIGKYFYVFVVIACMILVIRAIFKNDKQTPETPPVTIVNKVNPPQPSANDVEVLRKQRPSEQKFKLEAEKLHADIDARYSKFRSDVNAIYEKYRKMLPLSEAEESFKIAEQGADFIASKEGLCGWKVCATLAYKMAYDKVKHTNKTEDAILPIVTSRIIEPITNAVSVYSNWITEFRQELQKEDMAFAMDLALRSHKFNESISVLTDIDVANVSGSVDKLITDIQNHAKESAYAGVGAAVELVLIKSSYVAIKNLVVKIASVSLSAVAQKMAGTATAAAGSAVADGPLPIGDIVGGVITIGGLVWSSYDIYHVTKQMPDEMKAGIMESINETRSAIADTGVRNLKSDRDACLKSAETRVAELNNLIK